jgi:uncharacterized protein with HEPN domain
MENKDFIRLQHMLDSTNIILGFIKGKRKNSLKRSRLLLSAILRELAIIGEAANRISEKTKKRFPDIPWPDIIGMRNRLIHAYFDVDHDIVWKTVRNDLPVFRSQLKRSIASFYREF